MPVENQPFLPVQPIPDIASTAPTSLDQVVGQRQAVAQLKVALAAHRSELQVGRASSFPHVLLDGPPGLGKTLFAHVIANELQATVKELLGQALGKLDDLHATLIEATDQTILTIDEAHLADVQAQTALLRAVEDRVLLVPRKAHQREVKIPLAKFTLVLATTDPQGLISPLRERMGITLHLKHYKRPELAAICNRRAAQLGWQVLPTTCIHLGRSSQGTPRIALRNLAAAWRLSRAEGLEQVTPEIYERAMKLAQIDPLLGLDWQQQRYMQILKRSGGTARLSVIAARLGLPIRQLVSVIEPFLIRSELVVRLEHGRTLTREGDLVVSRLEPDNG